MRSKRLIIFISCIIVVFGTINIVKSHICEQDRGKAVNNKGVAVVELFTSEGCSSCPPADEVLSKIKDEAMQNHENIFTLAFHVDYWNHLGWIDRFSSADYSKRQQKYCSLLNCSVYTPQMIVNGTNQFVGSGEKTANDAINDALNDVAPLSISLQPNYNSADRSVTVAYKVQGELKNELLNVALVQKAAQSDVSKGENAGHHLSHVNVVRDFQTVVLTNADGTVKLILPADVSADGVQLVAYTQLSSNLKVTGATEAALSSN